MFQKTVFRKDIASIILVVFWSTQLFNGFGSQNPGTTAGDEDFQKTVGSSHLPQDGFQPNFIVLMVDDLAVLAFNTLMELENNEEYKHLAPNLRKMRDQSITFKNSYIGTPLCCPSRATFLTGLYSHNHQVLSNGGDFGGLPVFNESGFENRTLAVYLREAGYKTGFIGKYLNGYTVDFIRKSPKNYQKYGIPPGWDDWQGLLDPTTYRVFDYIFNDNGQFTSQSEYSCPYGDFSEATKFNRDSPDLAPYINSSQCQNNYQTTELTMRALGFISESTNENSSNRPFFLSITPLAPHIEDGIMDSDDETNQQASFDSLDPSNTQSDKESEIKKKQKEHFHQMIRPAPKYIGMLENLDVDSLLEKIPSFDEKDLTDKPKWIQALNPLDDDLRNAVRRQFKRALEAMLSVDDLLGEVTSELEKKGLSDNTIILFTSDNGYFYGQHRLTTKGFVYEESVTVPLMIQLPDSNKRQALDFVVNIDLAPTLLDLAGLPANKSKYRMDGRSLVPILESQKKGNWRKQSLIEIHNSGLYYAAIRTDPNSFGDLGNYVYVESYSEKSEIIGWEMYDLNVDSYQINNLLSPHEIDLSKMGPVQTELRERLYKLKKCKGSRRKSCKKAEEFGS